VDHGPTSYDVVPYTGTPVIDSYFDRLATIATLFGMNPPDVSRARVLDIGCASGTNLIPMAAELPDGSFLGIDQSERKVADGHATIEVAGLKNIALRQVDILDAGPDLGTVDYIKGAAVVLGERFPQAMPFDELWPAALDRVARAGLSTSSYGEPERRRLAGFLLQSYGAGWLELHSHMPHFVREPGDRPATTPWRCTRPGPEDG